MTNKIELMNVTIEDNGAAFLVCVNGLITSAHNTLGGAWEHIEWMYEVASQKFTVGKKKVPVRDWLEGMMKTGYLDEKSYIDC